jgi:hypothetical protein
VLSAQRQPIVGASVFTRDPTSDIRTIAKTALQVHGRTAKDGFVSVPINNLRGRMLGAYAPEYVVSEILVDLDRRPGQIDLILTKGGRLTVACHTQAGEPLRGVEVAVSRSPLEQGRGPDPGFAQGLPVGNSAVAVYSSVSGPDGAAVLEGLPLERLYLQIFHPSFVLVSGLLNGAPIVDLREQADVQLAFDPVYCAMATILDDKVITWGVHFPSSLDLRPDLVDRLSWTRETWRRRVPGGVLCIAGIARFVNGSYVAPATAVNFDVFTVDRRWTTVSVPLRRLSETSAPEIVKLGKCDSKAVSFEVAFSLSTPSHQQIHSLDGVLLQPLRDGKAPRLFIDLGSNCPLLLPAGRYQVTTIQPLLRSDLDGVVLEVKESGTIQLPVAFEAAACNLEWYYSSGLRADSGTLDIHVNDKKYQFVATGNLSERVFVLPVGKNKLDIVTPMGGLWGSEIDVPFSAQIVKLRVGEIK